MQWEAHIHAGTHDYTNTHMLSMVIRQSCSSGMEPVATERERERKQLAVKILPLLAL